MMCRPAASINALRRLVADAQAAGLDTHAEDQDSDIRRAFDGLRELVEIVTPMGIDPNFLDGFVAQQTSLLLELAEHRRNNFDPRRQRSMATARRMLAAKRRMQRVGYGPREINLVLDEQFGYSRSRRNYLLAMAEAACDLPGQLGAIILDSKTNEIKHETDTS
jgi:hypothetical protein